MRTPAPWSPEADTSNVFSAIRREAKEVLDRRSYHVEARPQFKGQLGNLRAGAPTLGNNFSPTEKRTSETSSVIT